MSATDRAIRWLHQVTRLQEDVGRTQEQSHCERHHNTRNEAAGPSGEQTGKKEREGAPA